MTRGRKRILSIISFMIFIAVAIIAFSKLINVDAMSDTVNDKFKYYTSYEIQPGDTLISIAEEHICEAPVSVDDYVSEVKNINKLSSDKITSGKNIIIAYYSDEYK